MTGALSTRPPGPRGRPMVGTLYDYERDPLGYLTECRETYGDVFALTPYHVVVCRPDWAARVLGRTNTDFRFVTSRLTRRASMMSDRIDLWMRARRSAWHQMGPTTIAAAVPGIRERLAVAMAELNQHAARGVAACEQAAARAALHVFVSDIDDTLRELVSTAATAVPKVSTSSFHMPRWASPGIRRVMRANDKLMAALTERAAARSPHDADPGDVLDLLLAVTDPGTATRTLGDVEIAQVLAANMTNLYAVGGAALSWLMVAVGTRPELLARWRELRDTAGPTAASAWADAVVRETLRVHPPIWSLARAVVVPTRLGDHVLEAGQTAMPSPMLMQLDPRWWREDPGLFLPTRWLDPARPPHDRHAYLPYGFGPRVCVGAQLAHTLQVVAFELLASSWQVSISPSAPVARPASVVVPDRLTLGLTPR